MPTPAVYWNSNELKINFHKEEEALCSLPLLLCLSFPNFISNEHLLIQNKATTHDASNGSLNQNYSK